MGSAPDDRRGDAAAGASSAGAPADLLSQALAELYGTDPQEFTDRRKALSAAAKDAGDAEAAKQIAALRKPTRAAWVVNSLARAHPDAPDQLARLAVALRAAEQAKDGPRLRELSAERGTLIDAMTGQALAAAAVADPPAGLRDDVAATLTAALADPEVAAAFEAGTLTKAAEWAGFGLALAGGTDTDDAGPFAAAEPVARPVPLTQGRGVREQARPGGERRLRLAGTGSAGLEERADHGSARQAGETTKRRDRLAEERAARLAAEAAEEAAQAAGRRRKIFEDAERSVASAAAAAADVLAEEDRLEDEVRDLEMRLTRARAELADIRLRARRAETAERKAREALDRLPRPEDPG